MFLLELPGGEMKLQIQHELLNIFKNWLISQIKFSQFFFFFFFPRLPLLLTGNADTDLTSVIQNFSLPRYNYMESCFL